MQEINWAPMSTPVPLRLLIRAMFDEVTQRPGDHDRTPDEEISNAAIKRFVAEFAEGYGVTEEMIAEDAADWLESQAD